MKKKIKRIYKQFMSYLYLFLVVELIGLVFFPFLFKDKIMQIIAGISIFAIIPLLVIMLLFYLRYLESLYLKDFLKSNEFQEVSLRIKNKLELTYTPELNYSPEYKLNKKSNLDLVNEETGIILTEFKESAIFSRPLVRIEFTNFLTELPGFAIFNHYALNKPKVNRQFFVKNLPTPFKNKFKLYTKQPNLFKEHVYTQIYSTFASFNSVILVKKLNTLTILISDKVLRLTPTVLEKDSEYLDKLMPSLDSFKKILTEIKKLKQA